MPPFWFGLIAIELLVVQTHVFYSVGLHGTNKSGINLDYFRHLALPVSTLCVQIVASWSRFERASMLDVMGADYVRTARAKGLRDRRVLVQHTLRTCLIPVVTLFGLDFGAAVGGTVILIEPIFGIEGVGQYAQESVAHLDLPPLMALTLYGAFFVVIANTLIDLAYVWLDPRTRIQS